MKRCVAILPLGLLLGLVLWGCDQPPQAGGPTAVSAPPAPPPPPPPPGAEQPAEAPGAAPAAPPGPPPLPVETKVGVFAGGLDDLAAPANTASPPAPAPVEANTEVVKAGKGVGAKGRSLDPHEGLYVTPVKAYFAAKERIFFEIEFPSAYNLYHASSDDVPKDFDDLKAKVLDPNMLTKRMPVLPQGHKYVWIPETQELGVERPRR